MPVHLIASFLILLSPKFAEEPQASGFTLAWIVMAGMLAALVFCGVAFLRANQGKPLPKNPAWIDLAIPVLSLLGLGVSFYLTYVETQSVQAICGPIGDCNAVQNSPYARLFGILPVGLLGILGYLAILAAWFWGRFRSDGLSKWSAPAVFGMAVFGTLFSIYLTYLELFVIFAVCIWCISSAVIITLIMLASLGPATQWLALADEAA
jgi:uncharacterized membrane protein